MTEPATAAGRGSIAYEPCPQDGHSHDWRDCPTPEEWATTTAARQVVRKQRKCWTCEQEHECYDIRPDHGWRKWRGEGMPWYVQPPKGVEEPCGGCGKPRMEHGFDA